MNTFKEFLGEVRRELHDACDDPMGCLTGPVKEETVEVIKDYDQWKAAVEKKYPQHKGKFQFKGRVEKGKSTISAEIKGMDRSFGVWDDDKDEGVVLGEGKEIPYHLMKTGQMAKKFEGRKVDFMAAVEAAHGRITPKKGADGKRYYIKGDKVLAKYDDVDDVGYIYK